MSLNRYTNKETIVQLNEPQYGIVFSSADLKLMPYDTLIPEDRNIISDSISQLHIYSFYGDYIAGDHNASFLTNDSATNSMLIDVASTFRSANIRRGSYIIAVNLFKKIWGNPDSPVVILREISPDRTELKLSIVPSEIKEGGYADFKSAVSSLSMMGDLGNLVVDFGFNKVCNVALIRYDRNLEDTFYIKLQHAAVDELEELTTAWFGLEIMDSYVDTVILTTPISGNTFNTIPGPNFDIDTNQYTSNATAFKTWDDLLDSSAPTTQRIIDLTLSGSGTATLNIDYTDYNNFIFYSSAVERLENFKYKLNKIETYNSNIYTLQQSTASISTYISSSISLIQRRVDQITTTFDHFERWLYYSPTASIFTHDITGSITPYPKYLQGGKYILHPTTSSIATAWYNGVYDTGSMFDQHNHNRLWWAIPEHILMDPANSDYILFVEMVAQHFDNLHAYIQALTQIHARDEHFERGASNDLLYHIAKSYGWNLQNTRQLSDLWFYKLGTNSDGAHEYTGSMFSLSHENQTKQIWKRIVNNLPYLLKTKGTSRSVKALMSIYGIPQTLISIKEYGGPSEEDSKPQMIEDRYAYLLKFSGAQSVELDRYNIGVGTGSWDESGVSKSVPDEVIFRFKSEYSGSSNMSLWAIENRDTGVRSTAEIRLKSARQEYGTSSYSGSYTYGKLEFIIQGGTTSSYAYYSGSTDYLPLFDGDIWTVRLYTDTPITSTTSTGSFNLTVGRADDCTFGTYIISSSVNVVAYSGMPSYNFDGWGVTPSRVTTPLRVRLGGTTASLGIAAANGTSSFFYGSMQSYKEYYKNMSPDTFKEHILNPSSYHLDEPTASFYDLYRYFPLGADVIRHDHVYSSSISSSHPNRDINFHTTAVFNRFTGTQETQYESNNETYYVYTPTIGPNNVRNNKIRLESTRLLRDLSPNSYSERSQFDMSSFDTGRLAIVFSLADQVNKDIYNQFGFTELDDWIADPALEYESEYSELKRFSNQYWQKYEQSNDINAFIRILSVYDYTFFEQIRQLAPGRSDLIAGILVEPNILERSKVHIFKRPTVENPQWETELTYNLPTSGEFIYTEGIVSASLDFNVRYDYLTGSIESEYDFNVRYDYLTGSIPYPWIFTASSIHHTEIGHQRTGICGTIDTLPKRYSGSQCETQSYYDNQRIHSCKYKKVIYHYSSSAAIQPKYLRHWYTAVSMSYNWYYSRSLDSTGYQIDECSSRNRSRFVGSKLSSPDWNVDSSDTVDGGPVVTIWESNPNNLFNKPNGIGGGLFVQ